MIRNALAYLHDLWGSLMDDGCYCDRGVPLPAGVILPPCPAHVGV